MKKFFVCFFLILLGLGIGKVFAADPETQAKLAMIQQQLNEIKETQKQILEGQDKLSKEHEQLRYWVYRK